MATLKPGSLLDRRYRVVQTLAKGGFGQTYIAEDTRRPGNPRCVVKHLRPASSDSKFLENARRLFSTEAEILEKLGTHDQIPRLLAYFEEEREFYLVQDLIEGHTLTHELQMGYRWSEAQVCQLLRDALSVLEFVHQCGVIHRDIKPENLIRRQPDQRLVLVDFGTVKQIRTQRSNTGQSNITIAVGTPGYMPTEQNHGKPRPNSDLYALGIISLQAATGLLPGQLQDDVETGELVWQPWAQQIRPDLAAILDRLVRYHFKDRYQSATEVLQALDELFTRHPDLLAEVESHAPPDVASMSAAKALRLSQPPSPLAPAPNGGVTNPVIATDLVRPLETSVTNLANPSQPLMAVTQLEEVTEDTPTVISGQSAQSGSPPSGQPAQPVQSGSGAWVNGGTTSPPSAASPLEDATVDPFEPLPEEQVPEKVVSTPVVMPLDRPAAISPVTHPLPPTRIDPDPLSSTSKTKGRSPLSLARLTHQPAWLGIGAVVALIIGIPALFRVLPIGHPSLVQMTGLRTVFTPAQQSLSKVLLLNLPCQAFQPKTQLVNPLIYPDGTQYFGRLQGNLPSDRQGTLLFPNGSRYDGGFQNGEFSGCGQYTYPANTNYSNYLGQFQNNAFNGLGTLSFAGGDRYIGEFRNGRCHGQGTFISANGALKRSNWQNGNSVDGDVNLSCIRD
ncbi:protein kinase [Oscillatoria sp. FACHB-1407]|uniref:protein kinase domain-containing protein n=1 Tax=Oscillatoria sp. FACHB-1407 TaxID=2692847 RepID=UPI0016841915|nr:protein kinase [Oscillatoria sp. FACHB-1407]MBD2460122.1 protein kinase [Oscillatoria sp. FACHB-1407]